jgi:hypothetical protein
MRRATLALALAAAGWTVTASAAPTLSGTYLINWTQICGTDLGVTGAKNPAVLSGLTVSSNGLIRQGIGKITFTPSATSPLTGTYVVTGFETQGSASVIQPAPGSAVTGTKIASLGAVGWTGPFTVGGDQLTLGTMIGGQPGDTFNFDMVYAPVAFGSTQRIELLRHEPHHGCTLTFSASAL